MSVKRYYLIFLAVFILIVVGLFFLTGCKKKELGGIDADITNKLSAISSIQENFKTNIGKYKYAAPETVKGLTYTIHEYKTAKGEVGYWVIIKRQAEVQVLSATTSQMETITKTLTKSVGYGVLAEQLTFDWQ